MDVSEKFDKLTSIKLSPENKKAIDDYRSKQKFKLSRQAVANYAITLGLTKSNHG